jgi:hypothetical protein
LWGIIEGKPGNEKREVAQKMKQEALRRQLEAAVLAKIEAFVVWKSEERGYTFAEIEEAALAVGQQVVREMIELAVVEEERQERVERPDAEPLCGRCGQPMRYVGQRKKGMLSKAGRVRVRRAYYHCPACGAGFFPPGSETGD